MLTVFRSLRSVRRWQVFIHHIKSKAPGAHKTGHKRAIAAILWPEDLCCPRLSVIIIATRWWSSSGEANGEVKWCWTILLFSATFIDNVRQWKLFFSTKTRRKEEWMLLFLLSFYGDVMNLMVTGEQNDIRRFQGQRSTSFTLRLSVSINKTLTSYSMEINIMTVDANGCLQFLLLFYIQIKVLIVCKQWCA